MALRCEVGGRATAFVLAGFLGAGLVVVPNEAGAALIVRKAGGGTVAQLSDAIVKTLEKKGGGKKARVVELTGDPIADGARLEREAAGESVVFAVGPEAVTAAGGVEGLSVVALAVPNPAKLKTSGTYISIYPKLEQIFAFLKGKLHAKEVGFLYSASQNTEVAVSFKKMADSQGLSLWPLPVSSSADLARTMSQAMPKIDVLVLAVDPILFDRQNLKIIVAAATAAKKPTVGFLDGLPGLGVTVSLVAEPSASAALAVGVSEGAKTEGKKLVDVDSAMVVFSKKSAEAVGIDPEASGANKIE
jgi:ABC-type uncharacterized transport system substrate-binding protein